MKSIIPLSLLLTILLTSCIGDDIVMDRVDPAIRILNPIDSIAEGTTYQFNYSYLNNIGQEEDPGNVEWTSSNPEFISVDQDGVVRADSMGNAVITLRTIQDGTDIQTSLSLAVGTTTTVAPATRSGRVETTSTYELSGDFTLTEDGDDLILEFGEDYVASTALPGLYVYLANNPNTVAGTIEIGAVTTFSGAHQYRIPNVGINSFSHILYFCKPFNVKVGDGAIN